MDDIFKFWDGVPGTARIHSDDSEVLKRVSHHFELECLAGPFMGPLLTASVVLLFLSPGCDHGDKDYSYPGGDKAHAKSKKAQDFYALQRTGRGKLPSKDEHPAAWNWAKNKISQFDLGDYEAIRSDVAFLNISPYKSKDFKD